MRFVSFAHERSPCCGSTTPERDSNVCRTRPRWHGALPWKPAAYGGACVQRPPPSKRPVGTSRSRLPDCAARWRAGRWGPTSWQMRRHLSALSPARPRQKADFAFDSSRRRKSDCSDIRGNPPGHLLTRTTLPSAATHVTLAGVRQPEHPFMGGQDLGHECWR